MKINYYLNFKEENRISMNQYANRLIKSFMDENDLNINSFIPKLNFISKILGEKNGLRYARYLSYPLQVKKNNHYDVAHICDHQYGHLVNHIKNKVKIITVHDLIPLVFEKENNKNPFLLKYSLKRLNYFDKVISISENTKRDIIKFTNCPADKIKVIYQSVENFFNTNQIDIKETCKKYKIPYEKKKILISGNIFYKNNKISYKVIEELIKKDENIILLHLGGVKNQSYSNKLIENKHYFILNNLDYKEIPNIYKISDVFFFPSIYEGYGLPLIEAMKCGLPVICSNNSSIPEIINDAGLSSQCDDINFFVQNIYKILTNKLKKKEYVEKSINRSHYFNLEKHNQEILNVYDAALNKKRL
jgi:glycosyltransferase involved in cell wall biosynthesis